MILHVTGRGWGETTKWWFGVKSVVGLIDLPFSVSVVMVVVNTRENERCAVIEEVKMKCRKKIENLPEGDLVQEEDEVLE